MDQCIIINTESNSSGFATVPSARQSAIEARYFRLTFPGDKIVLNIGPGDHTSQQFELTKDQLRGLVQDAMPELLR